MNEYISKQKAIDCLCKRYEEEFILATLYDLNRMCRSGYDCVGCPVEDACARFPSESTKEEIKHMEEAIDKWVKEHKQKTYLADFKKKFPNARINRNGTPGRCPNMSLRNITFGISSLCKACTKREIGCHSQCLDYCEYKKTLKEVKKTEREDGAFREYKIETIYRTKRSKK